MRFRLPLLPGLLLAAACSSLGQTVPAAPAQTTVASASKLLLKVGLNPGRSLRWSGFYGLAARLPVSIGAEYSLGSRFTLCGQFDSDFRLSTQNVAYGDQRFVIPTGALGVGARHYYNQAGRERHNRAQGPFVGNYLALEAQGHAAPLGPQFSVQL
ncbi:hypothetical protein [Hymenobacter terricola]|uniref:hypothetical protein n=1 Tax=Hymenobacter terricola TaxID=2819236 RepID=UPI001B304A3E|nr:hypothetical protein [Hymenobacter terricola]